jgi:hypothetical protein
MQSDRSAMTQRAPGDDGSCATRNAHAAAAGVPPPVPPQYALPNHNRPSKIRPITCEPLDRCAVTLAIGPAVRSRFRPRCGAAGRIGITFRWRFGIASGEPIASARKRRRRRAGNM